MTKRRTLFALAVMAVVLVPGAAAVSHAQQLAPVAHSSAIATPSATVATATLATMAVATSAGLSGTSAASPVASTSSPPSTDPSTAPPADPSTTPPATPPPTAGGDDCTDDCGDSTIVGSIAVSSPPPSDLSTLATATVEAATAAALAADPTATVDEVHLTVVDGYLVYEVEMTSGAEYLIDAGNTAILLAEAADPGTPDTDDEEDDSDDEDDAGDTEDEQEDDTEDDDSDD